MKRAAKKRSGLPGSRRDIARQMLEGLKIKN